MAIPKEVVASAIGAIPALLAPVISSFLQRRGFAQKAKEMDVVEKRVEIIERLLMLENNLSYERKRLLQVELADIAQDLVAERVRERAAGATVVARLPIHRRWLLSRDWWSCRHLPVPQRSRPMIRTGNNNVQRIKRHFSCERRAAASLERYAPLVTVRCGG